MTENGFVSVLIHVTTGEQFTQELDSLDILVSVLQEVLANRIGCSSERVRVIFKGRVLQSDRVLSGYSVVQGSTLYVTKIAPVRPESRPSSTHQASINASGSLGRGLDSSLVESMLSNPEMLQAMMELNPQMQALMRTNPELRATLSDPALLRQSLRAASSPAVMQEMLRTQDRAMANIESMPGGHNALRRMYREVAEPLGDAAAAAQGRTSPATDSGGGAITAAPSFDATPTSNPMPNPWVRNSAHLQRNRRSGASAAVWDGRYPRNTLHDLHVPNPWAISSDPEIPIDRSRMHSAMPTPAAAARLAPTANPWASQSPDHVETSRVDGASSSSTATNPWAVEQRFAQELAALREMGFCDDESSIRALLTVSGDVDQAITKLLGADDG